MFVSVGADQVFEGVDFEIELLLAGELRFGTGAVSRRLGCGSGGGMQSRILFNGRLLLGKGEGQIADFRGEFGEGLAGGFHRR